jgi:hypothetical protein
LSEESIPNTGSARTIPQTQDVFCEAARKLLDDFGEAVQGVLLLQEQQFHAVVEGDTAANRFDLLIHEANQKKQDAKFAYMMHLHEHGCSPGIGGNENS